MKKSTLLFIALFLIARCLLAQVSCVTMTCPNSVTQTALSTSCSAVVNYSAPIVVNNCAAAAGSQTFSFTGSTQTFVVPSGVTTLTVETWGAQGGANWVNNTNFGGYSKGTFTVTPGQVLEVRAGGQPTSTAGGYNGGGTGDGAGKGGGGASDVRVAPYTLNDRIIVGAGGGGAGYWSNLHVVGGVGGGLVGGDGYRNTTADPGGLGGTQSAGGAHGTCASFSNTIMQGTFGIGGNAGGASCGCEGYGGGGGWYGGASSGNCRGGGGGSGYILPTATNTMFAAGTNTANGKVVISYPGGAATATTSLVSGLASGASFPVGTTVQTFSVVTSNSASASCSFSVTVADLTTPTITCPPNLNSCVQSPSLAVYNNLSPVSVVDNCTTSVTFVKSGVTTGTGVTTANGSYNLGLTTVTYTAMDLAGNTGTCSFNVLVGLLPSLTVTTSNSLICAGQAATLIASGVANTYSWNTGATSSSIVVSPTVTTSYTVAGINANPACSSLYFITQNVNPCLGLNDQENTQSEVQILPNPNKGVFIMATSQTGTFKVINAIGQLILEQAFQSGEQRIDLSEQAKGIYTIRLESPQGIITRKVVIE